MRKYVAEAIGCFVLVFLGCGSAIIFGNIASNASIDFPLLFSTLAIAFSFGFSVIAMSYAIGPISGCHINPAVSLALWVEKKMSTKDFICYVVFQIIGAILASLSLACILGNTNMLGANGYGSLSALNCSMLSAILIEIILTFIFVFTFMSVTNNKNCSKFSGIIIGLTLTLVHIFGIPMTGTSVNPARSIGPALIAGGKSLSQLWVFILAPFMGSLIAVVIFKLLYSKKID